MTAAAYVGAKENVLLFNFLGTLLLAILVDNADYEIQSSIAALALPLTYK